MGLFELTDPSSEPVINNKVAQVQPTDRLDVMVQTFDATKKNYLFNSKKLGLDSGIKERNTLYKQLTGKTIYEDTELFDPASGANSFEGLDDTEAVSNSIDTYIESLRNKEPEKFKGVKTRKEIQANVKAEANESLKKLQAVRAGAPDDYVTTAAGFVGAIGASFYDPLNLVTLPLAVSGSRTLLKAALAEAALNMGIETVSQPFIADWQKELGNEYGISEMVENVALAGAFGAGATVGIRGASLSFAAVSKRFKEIGSPKASKAAKYLERSAHLEEFNLSKASDDITFQQHQRAIDEIADAANSGKAVSPHKIPIKDADFLNVDLRKIKDPILRSEIQRIQNDFATKADVKVKAARVSDVVETDLAQKPVNLTEELLQEPTQLPPILERQKDIEDVYNSPQARIQEVVEFDEAFEGLGDTKIFDSELGKDITIDDLRKQFKDENDFIDAITSCGVKK